MFEKKNKVYKTSDIKLLETKKITMALKFY